ncbi:transporter substrate-binding domain-containing protein [Sabulibacter ruber]|uniref:transporter substrate-binding domain-containing protein n=1 Tax=Sabulibacter ruber TaxID=2811901 RepID=UPI001A961FBE|nr:transporter substrate-binding domain-containing protein [Sabulibacter ruber]
MQTRLKSIFLLLYTLLFLAGCENYPKDPEKTLEKVTNGTLVVGYSENPPWVVKGAAEPAGIEPELVKAFAKSINASIQWQNDTEQNLLEELEKRKLHVVIAGITDDSPWKSKISFTRPFAEVAKKKHVMAIVMGENAFTIKLETFLNQQKTALENRIRP